MQIFGLYINLRKHFKAGHGGDEAEIKEVVKKERPDNKVPLGTTIIEKPMNLLLKLPKITKNLFC